MTFSTGVLVDPAKVGGGERFGTANIIINGTTFEDGLKVGRFCKLDTGSFDNLDGSATPVIAGVVLRNVANEVEALETIDADLHTSVNVIRGGLCTVALKSGETPAIFDRVYASNTTGEATATNTDIDTNAEFIAEIDSTTWLIYVTPAPGDVATHISDSSAAHAASAVSVLDTATFTANTNVETVLAEILARTSIEVTAATNAAAIPVTRSAQVNLATAGAETRTLAIPTVGGSRLTLCMNTDGGDCVVTVASAINQTGNNTITFNDVGDVVELVAIKRSGVYAWRVVVNDGTTLSTV